MTSASAPAASPAASSSASAAPEQSLVDTLFRGVVNNIERTRELARVAAEKRACRDIVQTLGVPVLYDLIWGDMAYAGLLKSLPTIVMSSDSKFVRSYECEIQWTPDSPWAQNIREKFLAAVSGASRRIFGVEEICASYCYPPQHERAPYHPLTTVSYILCERLSLIIVRAERTIKNDTAVRELGANESIEIRRFLAAVIGERV